MKCAVYCLAASRTQANRIIRSLHAVHFDDVSVLFAENGERLLQAGDGIAMAVAVEANGLDWISGIGAVDARAAGRIVAGGRILTTLYGVLASSREGTLADALAGVGVPRYEAGQYADAVVRGAVLILVHLANPSDIERVELIFDAADADGIACAMPLEPSYQR